jgi:type II secretory pathway pseudopilin PulG
MDTKQENTSEPKANRLSRILELSVVAIIVFLLTAMAMPNYVKTSNGHLHGELKSNIHNIQLSIERYGVDHDGAYPLYLIGGQGKYSPAGEPRDDLSISDAVDCPDKQMLSDQLLREGYIDAYPRNPFSWKNASQVHATQVSYNDPLRNNTDQGQMYGTRFGPYCTLIGNVLADKSHPEFTVFDSAGAGTVYPSYADSGYPYYDVWPRFSRKSKPYLPGMFFYRSRTETVRREDSEGMPVETVEAVDYALGVYGSEKDRGHDILGPDPFGVNETSTYGFDEEMGLRYGNPNGIRDAIILVLVPGED